MIKKEPRDAVCCEVLNLHLQVVTST
jgi:hypothetical protein